jgi:hypothetical protein
VQIQSTEDFVSGVDAKSLRFHTDVVRRESMAITT